MTSQIKPKPLKGENVLIIKAEDIDVVNPDKPFFLKASPTPRILFKKGDILSAVEWLKQKIRTHAFNGGYDKQLVLEFIDEAFEDVVKG